MKEKLKQDFNNQSKKIDKDQHGSEKVLCENPRIRKRNFWNFNFKMKEIFVKVNKQVLVFFYPTGQFYDSSRALGC